MSEASEKQTAILLNNGFSQADIDSWNKAKVSDEIGKIFGKDKKAPQKASNEVLGVTQGISKVNHTFQDEHEFGPAGNRWKIRFYNLEEYKKKREELENAGYLDPSIMN